MKSKTTVFFAVVMILFFFSACGQEDSKQPKIVKQKQNTSAQQQLQGLPETEKGTAPAEPIDVYEKDGDVLRIGIMDDFFPYIRMRQGGEPEGFDAEVLREILNRTDLKYEYVSVKWNRALQDLKVGILSMLPIAAVTPERKKIFDFTDSYIGYELAFIVHEDHFESRGKTKEELIESFYGKRVGMPTGYSSVEYMRQFKKIDIIAVPSDILCMQMVAEGKIDAAVLDKLMSLYAIKENQLPLKALEPPVKREPAAAAVYKGLDPGVIEKYDNALQQITEDGTLETIYRKWFLSADRSSTKPIPRKKTAAKKEETLKIGVMDDYFPYMRMQEDKPPKGFDVDVVREILNRADIEYTFVSVKWKKALADLRTGEISMLIAAAITPERRLHYNFTDSYESYQNVVFVRKETTGISGSSPEETLRSLYGKKVAVGAGYSILEQLRPFREQIEIITVPNDKIAFGILVNGEIDAVPNDRLFGLYHIKEQDLDVRIAGVPITDTPYATAACKKLNPEIIEKYNRSLEEMKADGTFKKICDKWFEK